MNHAALVSQLFVTNDVQQFIEQGGIIHSGVPARADSTIRIPLCTSLGDEEVHTPYVTSDLHVKVTCQKCLEWLHA